MVVCRFRASVLIALLVVCISAYGQHSDVLSRNITLSTQKVRLDTLLQTITRQTGIRFSYNSKRLNTAYKLTLIKRQLTVREALEQLKNKTNVLYALIETHIILNIDKSTIQKSPPAKPLARLTQPTSLKPISPEKVEEQKEVKLPAPSDTTYLTSSKLLLPEIATILKDSASSQTDNAVPFSTDSSSLQVATTKTGQRDSAKHRVTPVTKSWSPQKKSGYFIDLGVNMEETLFLGATLRTGTNSFFGTISLKSNGQSALVLYGLSGALRSGTRSRVLINTYFGKYSKSIFATTVSVDTVKTNHKIVVSGIWFGINTGIEWNLNSSGTWKLFAGLSFNALESKYKVDGQSKGLTGMPGSNPERKYAAFYPFYTLSNTYTDTSFESLKTWIGLHVGLYRTIFSR
ncbi:MAG TPA: hypothetical protein PKL56_00525 [Cyclobacteriaceae bacterium]|nr:hypothetical protein [Cyclobacteriaceae bacterium]HMV10277.1 hypothetical protein [Cyclobacteriaceae bacterium]HMV89655.1 hypothetical protein [Cyclobacteriaceae bacterium]HMW99757.1 hypothetical protein [Cyclobacteriaceae bacterium]HMX50149.1 hypothetical protein [Cyclobacteriaceae bacterium]